MKFYVQKFALVAALLFVALPALSQHHPMPTKEGEPLNKCIDCPGTNASGEDNEGLPVWPYADPLVKHVGRLVDSVTTRDIQQPFRTVRAKKMLIAPSPRGSAPPRVYVQLGSAIGVYSLDNFFTKTLPAGMVTITSLVGAKRPEPEKLAKWEGFVYPEYSSSGWTTYFMDGQDRLGGFDYDDRGYVYLATGVFGWGIVKDDGRTTGGHLPLIKQVLSDADPSGFTASLVLSVRTANQYWAVTSSTSARAVFDVTSPGSPMFRRILSGKDNAVSAWAKAEDVRRIATVSGEGKINIYTYEGFVGGDAPLATFTGAGGRFADVSADPDGTFWAVSPGAIHRFTPSGSSYTETTTSSGGLTAQSLNYRDNYLAIVGKSTASDGKQQIEFRVYKVESGRPVEVDLGGFFTKYYHRAPAGYAQPRASEVSTIFGGHVVKYGGKTYAVYNAGGLGDVFEIQSGDSISASRRAGTYGTPNLYSRPTEVGPFYGDKLGFTSSDTNALSNFFVEWNFANPESGAANIIESETHKNVTHQYTGLSTSAAVTAPKTVKVVALADSDIESSVTVTMVEPTARIGVADSTGAATPIVVDADNAELTLVLGDKLTDASDGEVEGHYASWIIDGGSPTNAEPDQPVDVGDYGPHTVTLEAKYGVYDSSFSTVGTPFVRRVRNLAYEVRPFAAAFKSATKSGSTVSFKASARKAASLTGISNWDVLWTLQTPSTSDVDPTFSTSATIGTIPNFDVTTAIPDGSVLSLTVSVPTGSGAIPDSLASHTISQTLRIPDPQIQVSGCSETGDVCSFKVTNAASDWALSWTLKRGATVVKTSSANPLVYEVNDPATYTISVVASTGVFESTPVSEQFEITEPACGNPPDKSMIAIATSCDNCEVNETVSIQPSVLGYNWTGCEEFEWKFGDSTPTLLTDQFAVTHKYTATGNKTIRLRIKKGVEYSEEVTYTIKIGGGTTEPTCTAPFNIKISYNGSKGCNASTPCKTGEVVTFTAKRGTAALQSCDSVSWTQHDGGTTNRTSFSSPGTYNVSVTVSNQYGSDSESLNLQVVQDTGGGDCSTPANQNQVGVVFYGAQSGCSDVNPNTPCQKNEQINFSVLPFVGYQIQACDNFEWDFGDGSAKKTGLDASHTYQTDASAVLAKLRVYNSSNTTGNTISFEVRFSNVAAKPAPVLSFVGFPATGSKGNAVTFTVNSNIPATGWAWDFGDGKKETQPTHVGTSSTITHVYDNTGSYTVTVKARNAEDQTTNAPTNSATGQIKIDEIPEFRYLLPVAVHAPGQGGSVWRTDVQIYNPDPNVSPQNTLDMTATFNGMPTQLHIAQSTYIYEDFMQRLTTADSAQGPVIITTKAKYAPQIWTRTYNQAVNGTFGQFIPAIRLDSAGGGSAVGEGRYFLAGLRHDDRYRTNVGLVNPTALPLTATIRAFDDSGLPIANGTFTRTLNPYQLDQFPIGTAIQDFPKDRGFSLEIEVGTGQWVIAYASFIDGGSNDPIFLQAIRESELVSEDYRTVVIPGVGHTGAWRSDVEIYNSNGRGITVDLAYHDATGSKVGEATNVPIGGGEFLHYADILKEGTLGGDVPDGLGMLRVIVPPSVSTERFPMAYARTYNDDGSGKTYGQGIAGFAAARPNVSATTTGLIPAVRSKAGEYYTNLFVTNVTDAPVTFSITVLDRTTGAQVRDPEVHEVGPYQTFSATKLDLGGESASLKIQATGNLWAYASVVDDRTKDPEYVPATPITP